MAAHHLAESESRMVEQVILGDQPHQRVSVVHSKSGCEYSITLRPT